MKKIAVKMIDLYQKNKTDLTYPKCRFVPSCSNYAKECYKKFNFIKASYLVTKRLLKCNKLITRQVTYDPVPEK